MSKGQFIVFEGLDGAGTTTQTDMLFKRFEVEKIKSLKTWEPSENKIGLLIRSFLKKEESFDERSAALLFAADRLEHVEKVVKPSLGKGINVLCDRYVLSSYAYQSLFTPFDFVKNINKYHLAPDITFLIDIDAEVALKRKEGESDEHYEKLSFQKKVRDNYLLYASKYKKSHNIKIIDGKLSADEIHSIVLEEVYKLM